MAAITCIVKISNINRVSSPGGFQVAGPPLRGKPGYRHLEEVAGLLEEYSIVTSMNFMSHSLQIC
jgi:hypothetical protein